MGRTPGRRNRVRYQLVAAASLVLALVVGLVGFAPAAFAHHPIVVGTSSCLDDGTYSVNWTISNSESSAERYMLIKAFTVTPNVGTTTGIAPNGSYTGIVSNGNPAGATIVAPAGSVPATTVGIPSGVTSITLSVTGYWHYPTGGGQFNEVTQQAQATVDLSKVCTGALKITKSVTGQTAPADATYTVTYTNNKGVSGQVQLKGGETKTVTGLPFGSYTLAEVGNPPNDSATISPNPAIVSAEVPTAVIQVTNAFPDEGGFTVTKHVTGETAGYVAGSTFTVHYSCSNQASGDLTLVDGQTGSVGGLPIGTTCALSETAKPDTTDPSYAYGTPAWDPSSDVTIVANDHNNVVAVVLANPITRVVGGFSVTKHVTGETGGYVAGSTFTVHYDCAGAGSGDLSLVDGQTASVGELVLGTTCTLSEAAKPDTTDPSYAYGDETWVPSDTVTVAANDKDNVVAVVLANPITRVVGGFSVTKHVTGETGGYVAGSTFTVHYDCAGAGSGDLSLVDGQTASVGGLPVGTECALSETAKPTTTDPSYRYGAESWDPSDHLTVTEGGQVVAVTLTNPITRVLGGFSVTKHVTGETGGYVDGSTFTVGYTCTDGTEGSITLAKDGTKSVGDLPLGTTCTLVETAKPDTTDGSYAWATESWDPSNVVTITSEDQVAALTLTNPIRRLLGGFSVTKHVTGETSGYVPGSKFVVTYDCGSGTQGALQLIDGETQGVGGLPVGLTCTLTEQSKPPTTDGSYAYGTETWDPSNVVTITTEDQVVALVLSNPIERVLGSFSVTKKVTGETGGYVPGSTFTVDYDCGSEGSGTLTLVNGATTSVDELPIGTTCTLSEGDKPDTTGPSYTYGPEAFDPSNVVTITANDQDNAVSVLLTNPIERVLGGFTVTKHVTGETAGYVPGSTFTLSYSCTDGTSGTLRIADGLTAGVNGLPIGTRCTVAESAKPPTTGSAYVWDTESWSPSNTVVIATNSAANTVALELNNPLTTTVTVLGATAAPGSLPKTGASDTLLLLAVAGLLLLAGGCFVVASKIED